MAIGRNTAFGLEQPSGEGIEKPAAGHWHWCVGSPSLYCSDQAFEILGLTKQPEVPVARLLAAVNGPDRERLQGFLYDAHEGGDSAEIRFEIDRGGDRLRQLRMTAALCPGPEGAAPSLFGTIEDITDSVDFAQRASQLDGILRALLVHTPLSLAVRDLEGRYLYVGEQCARDLGTTADQAIGKKITDFFPADQVGPILEAERQIIRTGQPVFHDNPTNTDVDAVPASNRRFPIRDADGRLFAVGAVASDVSQWRRAEDGRQTNEAYLRSLVAANPSSIFLKDLEGRYVVINSAFSELLSLEEEDIIGKRVDELGIFDQDYIDEITRFDQEVMRTRQVIRRECRPKLPSGRPVITMLTKFPILDANGDLTGIGSMETDITPQKQAERQLSISEQRLRDIADATSDWFWELDADLRFSYVSARYEEVAGVSPGLLYGKRYEDVYWRSAERQPELWKAFFKAVADKTDFSDFVHDDFRCDGVRRVIQHTGKAIFDSTGNFVGYRGASTDITARKQAEEALKASEAQLRHAQKMARIGVFIWDDVTNHCVFCSESLAALVGCSVAHYIECRGTQDISIGFVHPDDRDHYEEVVAAAFAGAAPYDVEYRCRNAAGEYIHCRELGEPELDESGRQIRTFGTVQDITLAKQAEVALRESEDRLAQAQKMEAVGQLTGGVDHDFNNLLSVILGNVELLEERLGTGDRAVQAIIRAATRGSELTDQLLAFSRRQPLRPRVIDLVKLVFGMKKMLSRTLGSDIEIVVESDPDLWRAFADPGQLENAFLNLAINARDAMPDGGRLTVSCTNLSVGKDGAPQQMEIAGGDYVVLTVADQGMGMAAEVVSRAFEPFFTTKEVGQGSGLGLSMVYGFAKQSSGGVTINSQKGQGTRIKLFLPRVKDPTSRLDDGDGEEDDVPPCGHNELILVVEDSRDLRVLTVKMLESLGFRGLGVASADEARRALDGEEPVDLILCDVLLPGGLSGPDFIRSLSKAQSGIKVLYMSGYSTESLAEAGQLDSGFMVLGKPFSYEDLAAAVCGALA